jgi:hypothetical protein
MINENKYERKFQDILLTMIRAHLLVTFPKYSLE